MQDTNGMLEGKETEHGEEGYANEEVERLRAKRSKRESSREKKMMVRFRCENEMCYEERETIEHMWNGCSEMREREGKERGEILNEERKIERREEERGVG
jgi:hypothetical protein